MSYRNLAEMQQRQANRLGPQVALRFKRHGIYRDITWQQYREMTEACALALIEAGIQVGDRVGVLAENRWEWLVADMAILAAGAVNVPPHASLTAQQVHFQLADAETRWLFVSTPAQLAKIKQIRPSLPALEGVVIFDPPRNPSPGWIGPQEEYLSWDGFLQQGRLAKARLGHELQRRQDNLGPDDLATIMYTSGTTGQPKGVMLTHGNLLSNVLAVNEVAPRNGGVLLSWLPYSHIYSRTEDHYLSQAAGAPLCLAESAETLMQNLAEIQPTHMSSVPRIYEKILATVADTDPATTCRRLQEIFGPRINWLGCGGAPLSLSMAQTFAKAGLLLLPGYGLTECSPVISINRKTNFKFTSVGQPLPGVEVKIAPDGEVLTRGPHVMKGYWKNPQATAEVLCDGWLHTGDLGHLDEEGFLTITGRKKELVLLSSGKKVVPTQIERLLVSDPCIDQVVVNGEGRHFLTALIVPRWNNVCKVLAEESQPLPDTDPESLAKNPAMINLLAGRVEQALRDLAPWEQVKKIVIVPRPFSVAAEELTISLKLRRQVILNHHREELERLYR